MADDEIEKAMKDAATFGVAFMRDGKRVDPADVYTSGPDAGVRMMYRNWRGEVRERHIRPVSVWFGATQWHPEPQWFLTAMDLERDGNPHRDFALSEFGVDTAPALRPMEEAPKDGRRVLLYPKQKTTAPDVGHFNGYLWCGRSDEHDDYFAGWLPLPEVKRG